MRLPDRVRTISTYRSLLERYLRALEPLERDLGRFSWPSRLRFEERQKSPLIQADLASLGAPDGAMRGPSRSQDPLIYGSRAEAFGCLYVLEGETLGGRLILRDVQTQLGLAPATGASFFAGYGAETGAMWSSFLAILAEAVTLPDEVDEALSGARKTFRLLDFWINAARVGPPERSSTEANSRYGAEADG